MALHALGKDREAQDCVLAAISNTEELLGRDHPEFFMGKMSLARLRAGANDYKGAEVLVEEAIAGLASTIGMDHPTTIVFRTNRLIFLTELEQYEKIDSLCPDLIRAFRSTRATDSVGLGLLHVMWGGAKYHLREWPASDSLLLEAYKLHPSGDACWFLFKLADANGKNDVRALDWLSQCVTLRRRSKATAPKELFEAESALKKLATKMGRQDILEEFELE